MGPARTRYQLTVDHFLSWDKFPPPKEVDQVGDEASGVDRRQRISLLIHQSEWMQIKAAYYFVYCKILIGLWRLKTAVYVSGRDKDGPLGKTISLCPSQSFICLDLVNGSRTWA